jgi:hypothetical protein
MIQSSTLTITPERNLLAAMLRRALFDFTNGSSEEQVAATEWFFDGLTHEPFSFAWVCTHLNLDPESIQKRMKTLRSRFAGQKPAFLEAVGY